MPTFSDLYSSALDHELGDSESTRLFLTARRQRAINEGVQQFADLTECYLRQSTMACSGGVGEYRLLSTVNVPGGDFVRLGAQRPEYQLANDTGTGTGTITYVSGDGFTRRTVEWLNQYEPGWRRSTGGTPRFYYERMDGGQRLFGLFPPPLINSSQTGRVLLTYVAKPSTLTSDTDVPFAVASTSAGPSTGIRTDLEPYHQAAVHFAAHRLEKLRLDEAASQRQLQIFLGYVERFLRREQPKGGQTVKQSRSYFAEARRKGRTWGGPIDMNEAKDW